MGVICNLEGKKKVPKEWALNPCNGWIWWIIFML